MTSDNPDWAKLVYKAQLWQFINQPNHKVLDYSGQHGPPNYAVLFELGRRFYRFVQEHRAAAALDALETIDHTVQVLIQRVINEHKASVRYLPAIIKPMKKLADRNKSLSLKGHIESLESQLKHARKKLKAIS